MFSGLMNMLRLEDEYDDDFEDDYEEEIPSRTRKSFIKKDLNNSEDDYEEEAPAFQQKQTAKPKPVRQSKVIPMRNSNAVTRQMEVCVIKPTTVEDGREISDTLLAGRAVVLNLEGLQVNIAQRIIDFASGACYSINGNLQKVSSYIFVITPESVDISGDFQDLLASGGNTEFDVSAYRSGI